MDTMTKLVRRGLAAYLSVTEASIDDLSGVEIENAGKRYVIIKNKTVIAAVYRVRQVLGKDVLKRLRRYPKELMI